MMECGWCSRWVHARCEGLSGEGYQLVSALPHSVEYICKQCLPENAPWRNMIGTYLRGKLLGVLKALAKNKNACTLLKLTPHKNTSGSKKTCLCSSSAVRKLQFSDSTNECSDTNSLNVTFNLLKNEVESESKLDKNQQNEPAMLSNQSEKIKGTVHKLQESLLQNKEICLSMGPCLSHNENIHHLREKYHIRECCVKMKNMPNSDELSCHGDEYTDIGIMDKSGKNLIDIDNSECCCVKKDLELSPSLLDIKTKVNCNEYSSVKDFNKDMLEVISRIFSPEVKQIYKDVFTETFPWFDCELNSLNPSLEIEDDNEDESSRDEDFSAFTINKNNDKIPQKLNEDEQIVPSVQADYKNFNDCSYEDDSLYDNRICVLCKIVGEGNPSMEERLLYCGQGDWIHANCALWSAEVFEEIDGSLQNVQSAIARGKMIKCSKCLNKGASVGCCAKNCSETYHFTCARSVGCALLDDKRVFCPAHVNDAEDKALQKDNDFVLSRPVYVELDRKKKKYCDPQKVQFLLGSLIVKDIGKIVPSVSDFEDVLIPVDFLCARLYWSSKQPWKIVKYTIRTKLLIVEPSPAFDLGVNITLDHSMNPSTVERILAEIEAWHKSLETGSYNLLTNKKDKSPIKFGCTNVSLEDYAVKQVVEYMLDIVCKQDPTEDTPEEEPQNTADLLPPELKDAIFEDLNHDLLDGISMQDIFPKLCYEDLVAMDLKNEVGFGSDVTKENKLVENVDDNLLKQSDEIALHEKVKKSIYLTNINNENQLNETKNVSSDFLEEIINNQNENGKELKRSKSDLFIQTANIKNLASNRNHQRSCSLTWNYKIDNALSSTIKRCKFSRPNFLTRSDGSGNVVMIVDGTTDLVTSNTSKLKIEELSDNKNQWQSKSLKNIEDRKVEISEHSTSPSLFFKNVNNDMNENSNEICSVKHEKSNDQNEQVIDFYTKMHCSPISQLDGADDISPYNSNFNSPISSPKSMSIDDMSIPQLDGAEDISSSSCSESGSPPRDQNTGIFFRPNNIDNTYTMTISAANLNNVITSNEILIRSNLDDNSIHSGQGEQMVKCDRCHCTYRTKDSFNRHLPSCDLMSTSESEGETPKSPEARTLTTLQNAFNGSFITPTYISPQAQVFETSDQLNVSKPALVSARRTSVNTRQITINGTIVETPSPDPQSPMKINHDLNNDLTLNIKAPILHEPPKITLNQGIISQPQIMVATNLPMSPPRNQTSNSAKCGLNSNQPNIPYSICVKPSTNLHALQPANSTITHMLPNSGGIQTVFSNPNQVLTITNPQQNIIQNIHGKPPIMQAFTNIPNGQTLTAVPVNSLQGLPSTHANNINTFVRPSLPLSSSSILMSPMNPTRISSPNIQQKNQVLLPHMGQKSPKKLQQVQPKPIFQASRGRARTVNKTPNNKRPNKQDKPITNINPSIGPNGAVIQFQPNSNTNQPSIILQQVANPNVVSYVEAIQQQTGPNMQYIATIAPQGDFKPAPTHYITQGGILPQTFQIQQTENGGLVAVPSGAIPVFLPQSGVGILPQPSIQSQGMALASQGNLQTQAVAPILPQGTIQTQNGTTILPQTTIQTQNGATIIPQGAAIQSIPQTNIQPQGATILPANSIQTQGTTIVPHNNINNTQNIMSQPNIQQQNNTIISQQPNTIIPQGAILPQGLQFCNDQVLLGSAPTLEMVTDSSGCMYLTAQPVYYGLETIVQNTVMSSQQFVSTAMQGVLAQNSSFSATTTQVFQASKIEPIVEMPTGYVVVNNVPQDNIVVTQPNAVNSQTILSTQAMSNGNISVQTASPIQIQKNPKSSNIAIQPNDKSNISTIQRTGIKSVQNQPIFNISTPNNVSNTISLQAIQPRNIALTQGKQSINLQTLQPNIIQSANINIPVNTSPQNTISNVQTDNLHLHVGQPIMSNNAININNTSPKITSVNQFNSQNTLSDNSTTCNDLPTLQLQHVNGQPVIKTNFSQPQWKSSQNYITTSSDTILKHSPMIIQSNEMQKSNNNMTIITSLNNPNNITNNIMSNNKNFGTFNQTSFNESLQSKIIPSPGPCTIVNSNPNALRLSPSSYPINSTIHNISPASNLSTSSPYIVTSGINQPINNCINILPTNNAKDCENELSSLDQSNIIDKNINKSTSHQMSCNVHRNLSTSISENMNSNYTNILHLPGNMVNLPLQGGKIYQIPISSAHGLNTPVSVQNHLNCNMQNSIINSGNSPSINQINNGNIQEQMINSSNNFQIINGNINQTNSITNQISNVCNQHQMDSSNNQNQMIALSNSISNTNVSNTSSINNCNSINQLQMVNGPNQQLQISNGGGGGGGVNLNIHNICNNNRLINGDQIQLISSNGNQVLSGNSDINKLDGHINTNERNGNNINYLNRNQNSNSILNNNYGTNQIIHDNSSHCDMTLSGSNISQFQNNSDQMFLINGNPNSQVNIVNNISNRFQNPTNQSSTSIDIHSQQNNITQNSQLQNISNHLNGKQSQKQENFGSKIITNINMPIVQSDTDCAKMSIKQNPVLSLSNNNQIGYIQMSGNNGQILSFTDNNRIPILNSINGQIQNQKNQSTPMITIGQGDLNRSSPNCNNNNENTNGQTKTNDMPSLSMSLNSSNLNVQNLSNSVNKQIHLPQHNITNNCLNNTVNFSMPLTNVQSFSNLQLSGNQINSISLPAQNVNNTISLPIQNTSNITLPKAPPHQSGLPTNVVNPIPQYMRPMNRVLPIHREAQSNKISNRSTKIKVEPPKPSPRCNDMPELNMKEDETISNDIDKNIRETKSHIEQKSEVNNSRDSTVSSVASTTITDNVNKQEIANVIAPNTKLENRLNQYNDVNKACKTLKENIVNNIKNPLQKDFKLCKENSTLFNLKSQNIVNQRKVQMRTKIGSENILNIKMNKHHTITNRVPKEEGPKMIYEVSSEDGFNYSSTSLSELWNKVIEAVQNARKQHGLPIVKFSLSHSASNAHILGLHNNALKYLVEQLPGASRCMKYKAKHGGKLQGSWDSNIGICESFRESPWGTARVGPVIRKSSTDMFNWLASPYRDPPPPLIISQDDGIISRRVTSTTLPMAMRFRHLKEASKHSVGVYRSHIHGRGLFCRRDIQEGEMVIEYAGEVIRAALADQRERRYEAARGGRGVTGCYMFRVDDHLVVDATMKGNAARFINHSCDPNCYSKVVDILGHKHILILALRRIYQGEELTYDYKFPFEEVKIPCTCGAKKCRKYLN